MSGEQSYSPFNLQLPSFCSCMWLGAQLPHRCGLGTTVREAHHRSEISHGLPRSRISPPGTGLPLPARAALEQRGAAAPPHRCSADQSPGSVERFIRLILISLGSGSSQNRHSTNSADNLPLLLSIKLSVCNLQHGY